ncbi:MAG: LamG-like jellyroll fold domain-containing protein, partial [Lentisphaeria bacterium]
NEFAFTGQIDEVRVWNHAKSSEEIELNMYRQINESSEGLLLNYRFADLGDNNIVVDYSLNGIKGSVVEKEESDKPWRTSYAMVRVPMLDSSNVTEDGFTINWRAPNQGLLPNNYLLYISTDSSFTNLIPGYSPKVLPADSRFFNVNGLDSARYYYKVIAVNNSVIADSGYEGNYPIKSTDSEIFVAYLDKIVAPGNRLFFDGNRSYLTMPQTGKLAIGSSSFTIEFWMKSGFNSTSNSSAATTIITNKQSNLIENGYSIRLDINGALVFQVNDTDLLTTIDTVDDNKWHHIACVLDRSEERSKIYIDGKLARERENSSKASVTNYRSIYIGATPDATTTTAYRGELDELRIWNSARSQEELASNMSSDLLTGNLPNDLVGYLLFDEYGESDIAMNEVIGAPNAMLVRGFNSRFTNSYYKTWDKSHAMGAVESLKASNYRTDQFTINWDVNESVETDYYQVTVTNEDGMHISGPTNISNVVSSNITGLNSGEVYNIKVEGVLSNSNRMITSDKLLVAAPTVKNQPGNALAFPEGSYSYVKSSPLTYYGLSKLSFDSWLLISEQMAKGKAPLLHTRASINDALLNLIIGINSTEEGFFPFFQWLSNDDKSVNDLPKLPVNEWFHMAVTFDLASDGTLTVNITVTNSEGKEEISTSTHSGSTIISLFESLYHGNVPKGVDNSYVQFVGMVDEMHLWNEVLTSEKISKLYNSPMNVNSPIGNIIASYQMNQPAESKYAAESISGLTSMIVSESDLAASFVQSGAFNSKPIMLPATDLGDDSITINWALIPNLSEDDKIVISLKDPQTGNVLYTKEVAYDDVSVVFSEIEYGVYNVVIEVHRASGVVSSSEPSLVTTKTRSPGFAISNSADDAKIVVESPVFGSAPDEFTVEFWCKPKVLEA